MIKSFIVIGLGLLMSVPTFASDTGGDYNFRVNPLALLGGSFSVGFDVKMNDQWTIGPEVSYGSYRLTDSSYSYDVSSFWAGARWNYFTAGVFKDGWYIGPTIGYGTAKVSYTGILGNTEASVSTLIAGALFGYGWFWEKVNLMLGLGYAVGLGPTTVKVKDSSGYESTVNTRVAGVAGEFSVGWTF